MTTPVPDAPVHLVKGSDPSLVRDAVQALVEELVGDADRSLVVDEYAGGDYEVGAVADAARTPPFLTERRVVVGRDLHEHKADAMAPLVDYLADPLPSTSLVLVWESGAVPKALAEAVKQSGGVTLSTDPGGRPADVRAWLAEKVGESGLRLDRGAVDAIADTLGQDLGRLHGLLESLASAYGPDARLGVGEVAPYLGEAGGVAPWDLTDAIDGGDIARAVEVLHRIHPSNHALVVMANLHNHFGRMLALDGAEVGGEADAAALLGMKGRSTFPAKKALQQGRRLGSEKVQQATVLLAQTDLDLRGAKHGPDEVLLEVLVARLANLARR